MKNLKLKEKVEENFQDSVTEAGASSSSLTSKEEDGIIELKNLKIQETGQCSKSEQGEEVYGTPKSDFGDEARRSCFFGEAFSKGKNKMKPKSVVILRSCEGDTFEVEESIAMLSQTLRHMIEDCCDETEIPIRLTNISSKILEKVLVFLEKHVEKERDEDEVKELKKWDEEFVDGFKDDQQILFGMILAADFLAAQCLLDVTCQACADLMKGKSPEYIRKYFSIKNDFSPEEEAEYRAEKQAWTFDG
ncbi:hypothetical protein MKW98_023226 [Papaver atlanticum]|uniref:SKP1-like protein n=1 Tax=Papaver atlanticum TaxID=357466 RepID=A0AAD4TCH5_9MAGN|nr:hypothetical protein MKW98_023226 [Papaver atlanticum]